MLWLRTAITGGALLLSLAVSATDYTCTPATAGGPQSSFKPAAMLASFRVVDAGQSSMLANRNEAAVEFKNRIGQTSIPVNPGLAGRDAHDLFGDIKLSLGEKTRQTKDPTCSAKYDRMMSELESSKVSLGLPQTATYSDFVDWYIQPSHTASQKIEAELVLAPYKEYEKACLESAVPEEMNPVRVRSAVGVLVSKDGAFCTGLRTSATAVVTARHCFVDDARGKVAAYVTEAIANKDKLWFIYESEPSDRFEVCADSLPTGVRNGYSVSADRAEVRIAQTHAPVPILSWAQMPLQDGTSLYLRGFDPIAAKGSGNPLERLRSTAVGQCYARQSTSQCFLHACQSFSGMSGAPIFVRPDPSPARPSEVLTVAGMHIGSSTLAKPDNGACEGLDGTVGTPINLGVQIH